MSIFIGSNGRKLSSVEQHYWRWRVEVQSKEHVAEIIKEMFSGLIGSQMMGRKKMAKQWFDILPHLRPTNRPWLTEEILNSYIADGTTIEAGGAAYEQLIDQPLGVNPKDYPEIYEPLVAAMDLMVVAVKGPEETFYRDSIHPIRELPLPELCQWGHLIEGAKAAFDNWDQLPDEHQ